MLLTPLLLVECSSLPPWNPIPTGQSSVYGQIDSGDATLGFISFSDYPDIVAISVGRGGYGPRYALIVEPPARAAIEEACAKYFSWQKRALDNQVAITKEIRTITVGQMYRSGARWEYGGTRELRFIFAAQGDARPPCTPRCASFPGHSGTTATSSCSTISR